MTADDAGKTAAQGIWATLRTLKEQWVLIVFVTGALFWARDTWEELSGLPATVAAMSAETGALARRIETVEAALAGRPGGQGGQILLSFPGGRHRASDARPGGWSEVRLDPVRPAEGDCAPVSVDAYVVDAGGRWFQARATVEAPPALEGEGELAFAVEVPAGVSPGRAEIALRFVHDCGGAIAVAAAPRLPFRVLPY